MTMANSRVTARRQSHLNLPGFTLPLNYKPPGRDAFGSDLFPNAVDYEYIKDAWTGLPKVHRDIVMMRVVNAITDKPDWHEKVFREDITSKWREELADSGEDVSPRMLDWIIREAQWKAGEYRNTGHVIALDGAVVKSDTAISAEVQQALKDAVRALEDVPEDQKDYHPGSAEKVVDLVHPSLFPVVYGRTHILRDRIIGLDDFLDCIGEGEVLPVPPEEESTDTNLVNGSYRDRIWKPYSRKFQWLPCDIDFDENGGCRIVSYINNLHPRKHRALYDVIEKVLSCAIPLWNTTLSHLRDHYLRIEYTEVEYLEHPEPEPVREKDSQEEWHAFYERHREWLRTRTIKLPEPGEFKPPKVEDRNKVDLRQQYSDDGLQVIVKLANIELTPEKPEYEGGSWHVEGQLNEHICATAIYYYDSNNITDSSLGFRQRGETDMSDIDYEQEEHQFLQVVHGYGPETIGNGDTTVTQYLGSVSTPEGRLLTFPNILQHRVAPFSLADRTKPGHRKIVALFLVDPHLRIISSAHVPPQRADWCEERKAQLARLLVDKLPPRELRDIVLQTIDDHSMTMDEAKEYRLELMEERKVRGQEQNEVFETGDFGLCEH